MAFLHNQSLIGIPVVNNSVSADISLQKAIAYLAALEIDCLLVEEAGQLQGWLTVRDVVKLAAEGRAGDDCALRMVMTQPPYILDPGEARDLSLVLHYFQKYRVDQLPVVADNGELLGLVTSQGIMPLCGRQLDYLAQLELHTDQFIDAQVAAQRDQNHFFQEITDSISGLIYIYDLEEQRNIYSNQYVTSALGYTPLKIQQMGQNVFSQIIHPEDSPQILAGIKMQETLTINDEDSLWTLEYRIRHADGSWRWWYSRNRPFRYHSDGRAKQIVGFAQDITDRKHIELELQSSQHFLQAITETIPGLVYIYDLQANQNVYVNSLAPEILGYTKAQIDELGNNFLGKIINPEDLAIIAPLVMEQLAQGAIAKSEYRLRNAQGEWRWVLEHTTVFQASAEGVPQQLLGIIIDIHDRKVAEAALQEVNIELKNRVTERTQELWQTGINLACEINEKVEIANALRQSEEFFRAIFEQAAVGINIATVDGRIVRANQKLCKMLGYTEAELLTTTWMEGTAPEFVSRSLEYTAKRYREEIGCDNFEKQLICKDGSLLWVDVTVSLWKDPLSNISYDIAIAQDISDRKAAEAQIQANLQEKELLLKEIHHRVKNNLQIISSLLTLQSQSIADPAILAMFQNSQTRIYAIALIHEQLYKTTQFEQINFAEYIENLVSYLHQLHSSSLDSIQIKTNVADLLLNIETAIPCGLIINELVINAFKYAFPQNIYGKLITIELQRLSEQRLALTIKDNGIGISDNYNLAEIDSLGLRLVKMLVQQLEGKITLTCNPGTQFVIIFHELKYSQRL